MSVKFKDIYRTEIDVGISGSGYIRIDMKGEGFPLNIDKVSGSNIPYCISMTENQARILIAAISELIEEE